jgi:cytochrome c oxidase subunit 2
MNKTMVVFNLIYLGLVAVGLVIFAIVFLSTREKVRSRPLDIAAWKRREGAWLYIVIAALVAALAATIFETPWRAKAAPNREVVRVIGQQFGFTFSKPYVRAGHQIEFQLTAKDTSHAFAIYDPGGAMIAQAQMMPGWDNNLRITFEKPGRYAVRCFEYCGVGHHRMVTTFEVRP